MHPTPAACGLATPGQWRAWGQTLPCPWAELSERQERRIGWLWSHAHFLVARVPGKARIWFSWVLGGRLAVLPQHGSCDGELPKHKKRFSPPKSSTHPMPLMVSIGPGFLLMVVVKLHPFPRTGEGGRATGPCQNSLGCGPMSQALSSRCQPNAKNVSRSWVAIQSTRPRLGWRARIAG